MSTLALFVCLLWLSYVPSCIPAYYLSPNHLPINEAQQFCREICKSNLASIINDEQRSAVEHTILSRRNTLWNTLHTNAWIGLMRSPSSLYSSSSSWTWMDGTNMTSPDAYPWSGDALASSAANTTSLAQYVSMNLSTFQFDIETVNVTTGATTPALPFICNVCDGVIHKYAVIATAQGDCNSVLGTSLAVLADDVETSNTIASAQWQQLYAVMGGTVRIGLTVDDVHNLSTYRWRDGSRYEPVDSDPTQCVGACTPWIDDGPLDGTGKCVYITSDGWNTLSCDTAAVADYELCHIPSELYAALNTWSVINGQFTFTHDGAVYTFENGTKDNVAVMADTYWYNGDEDVWIEYALNIQFGAKTHQYAGLALFNHASGACHPHYYALVVVDTNGDFQLALYRSSNRTTLTQRKAFVQLDFRWDDDEVYVLSINMRRGHLFELTLNGNVVAFNDSLSQAQVLPDASGYVGIVSSKGVDVRSQWLYVSGTPWLVNADVDLVSSCLGVAVDATDVHVNASDSIGVENAVVSNQTRVNGTDMSPPINEPDADIHIDIILEATTSSNSDPDNTQHHDEDMNTTTSLRVSTTDVDGDDDTSADMPPSLSILRWFDSFATIHYVIFSLTTAVLILVCVVCVLMCKNRKLRKFKKQSMHYVNAHQQPVASDVCVGVGGVGVGVGVRRESSHVLHHLSMKRHASSLPKQCVLSVTNAVLCHHEEEEEEEKRDERQPTDSDDDMYEAVGTVPMDSDGDLVPGDDRMRIMRQQRRLATGATSNADISGEGQVGAYSQQYEVNGVNEANEEVLQLMSKDPSKSMLNGSPKYAMQSVAGSVDALFEEVPLSQRN